MRRLPLMIPIAAGAWVVSLVLVDWHDVAVWVGGLLVIWGAA